MVRPDLQRTPCNFNLIKNGKATTVVLARNVFISVSFSIASYKQEVRKCRDGAKEKYNLNKQKINI